MKAKIIAIFVMTLFITISALPSGSTKIIANENSSRGEEVDQEQSDQNNFVELYYYDWYAQSFKPGFPYVTKIQLYLNSPQDGSTISVQLRKSFDDIILARYSIQANSLPLNVWTWVEFPMRTLLGGLVSVNIGETYYLIVESDDDDNDERVKLGYSDQDPYIEGEAWEWIDPWVEMVGCDLTFKTYGSMERPKNIMNVENSFNYQVFQKILENHPNMFPLIQRLFQRLGLQ